MPQPIAMPPDWRADDLFTNFAALLNQRAARVENDKAEPAISAARLSLEPYPHFFARSVLSATDLEEMRRHWPSNSAFTPEGYNAGVWVCQLVNDHRLAMSLIKNPELRHFWREFMRQRLPRILAATVRHYQGLLGARFGSALTELRITNLFLMEVRDGYVPHSVHTHHSHSPHWLFTNLIYVDDDGAPSRGTVMHWFNDEKVWEDSDLAADCALNFDENHYHRLSGKGNQPSFQVAKQIPFEPGAMFSFYETQVSFHAGPSTENASARGARRIIRLHVAAPPSLVSQVRDRAFVKSEIDALKRALAAAHSDQPLSLNIPPLT